MENEYNITNYRKFQSLSRKKIMKFDKTKNKFVLNNKINPKELVKGLRYIRNDFNYDLRKPIHPNTINKISNVMNEYFSLKMRENVKIYTPRKKHKKAIAELAQQSPKHWKKFYIPSDSKNSKIKYKKKNGKIIAEEHTNVAIYTNVYFDYEKLVVNTDKEVDRVTKGVKNKDYMRLHAGEHLVGGKYGDVDAVKHDVNEFMEKYGNPLSNNFYENWMTGIKIVKKFKTNKNQKKKKKQK